MNTRNTNPCFLRPRSLAWLISLTLGTFSVQALAEDTVVVSADGGSGVAQENAWGPSPTIAAKRSATGTKTDTPIEKNPQSISVVTQEEMAMKNVTSVKGAFNYTPGVLTGNRGSSNVIDALSIRGFSETNTNQYLDGLKLQGDNYSEFAIDPYFLERAELLRGPVSVLYGKSNPGGVVSLVSKRPTQETLREVQFQMGTNNQFSTGFDFGGSLDDDGVYSYRLTGLARSADAQQEMNKEKRYTIAPSFSWRPDENTRFDLLTYFQNEPETGYYGWLPRQGTVVGITRPDGSSYKLPTNFDEGEDSNKISRNTKMVGYNFEHSFNDTWTVRQNLRYADLRTDYRSIYGNGFNAITQQITRGSAVSDEKLNQFAVDNQAQAKFATGQVDHTLLLGVDFQRTRNDIDAQFGTASPLNAVNPQYGDDSVTPFATPYQHLNKQRQTGLYAQDQMEWNRWVLTLGGRYDYAMNSVYDRVADSVDRQNDQAFTWRGGLNYVFDNGIAPYFSYSEAFIPNAGATFGGEAFDPSRAKQYEAGVKYVPKDRPVVLTAAVYQLTKTKNLTADPDTVNHPFASIQSGEIRSRGVELEAKAALNANINMTASYTYTDAEYTEDTNLKGKTPNQVPKHMASLWGDYTFHETALSGVTLGAGVRYVGESKGIYSANDPANENQNFDVAGYTTVDAALKYDLARFGMPGSSIGVNVNNLFDREYVASCYRDYACYWGAERQIVGTATFRF
ncbi:iron complex outermembrane recepter protein [Candidatus Pantoea symbiotica]|jgi:iron complex outermembrane receptor protein|uniref:Iron complex outermembrane recepter protein n=1 Tax=Candidatus Pantoea symbiotica TaxID=1884370 RepID=A0A1I3XZ14_9GAMM|nr:MULTISPECIES: ferrichrome porin FhuA [Pantoea]KAJ9434179.1 ferrichrome porin FhuA [Pantoea sp. YR343]MRT24068.1 ferrichrome porin FhuA [Enterobacteriaceae bacterium RIT697]SFK24291.1 iron complex outermembrane recepter protein [Pantoea symbiotica]SFU82475.1 iron complex outermembrane recepter protein [Pantoea sp. YR525]